MLSLVKLILVVLAAASLSFGQARKITPSTAKPTAVSRTAVKATPAKASPVRSTGVAKSTYKAPAAKANRISASRYHRTPYRAPVRTAYVQSPSPDRYREIQQALADKGYYAGEVNGTWDSGSIDALNRFKADQKLKADGKLCSLSLIALGLGPKYEHVPVEEPSAPIPAADRQ